MHKGLILIPIAASVTFSIFLFGISKRNGNGDTFIIEETRKFDSSLDIRAGEIFPLVATKSVQPSIFIYIGDFTSCSAKSIWSTAGVLQKIGKPIFIGLTEDGDSAPLEKLPFKYTVIRLSQEEQKSINGTFTPRGFLLSPGRILRRAQMPGESLVKFCSSELG